MKDQWKKGMLVAIGIVGLGAASLVTSTIGMGSAGAKGDGSKDEAVKQSCSTDKKKDECPPCRECP